MISQIFNGGIYSKINGRNGLMIMGFLWMICLCTQMLHVGIFHSSSASPRIGYYEKNTWNSVDFPVWIPVLHDEAESGAVIT
jgi:hypothetical protein